MSHDRKKWGLLSSRSSAGNEHECMSVCERACIQISNLEETEGEENKERMGTPLKMYDYYVFIVRKLHHCNNEI